MSRTFTGPKLFGGGARAGVRPALSFQRGARCLNRRAPSRFSWLGLRRRGSDRLVLTSTRKMAMRKGSSARSGAIASTTLSSLARCNAPGPLSRTISIVSENFTRLSRPAIKAAIGKRSDFGMKTFLGAIGDDVDLIIVKSRPSRSPEEFAGTRRLTREELRPIKGVS
jgi:hypothetical protein